MPPKKVTGLTPMRMDILRAFQSGDSIERIEVKVHLSARSINRHLRELREEFVARNNVHLVVKLMRQGKLQ